MYQFELYYDPESSYASKIKQLVDLLEKQKLRWNADYTVVEAGQLDPTRMEQLQSSIRSIPPQVRGRIVSSRNQLLPLSGTKRLNLKNTPILLLEKDGIPADVYPHLLGTTYTGPEDALSRILRVGPDEYREARGILEDPLAKILFDYPESLERGMVPLKTNLETDAGVIDALLKDGEGNPVVVELETTARDSSVAQVCRLAAGYAESAGTSLKKIRKVIVCLDYTGKLETTCKGSGVELYKLVIRRII